MAVCGLCKNTDDNDQLWTCDQCQKRICTNCSKLSASEIKCMELKKQRTLKFYCKTCLEVTNFNKDLMEEMKKLRAVVKQQTGKIDMFKEEMRILTEKVEQFDEKNSKQSSSIETVVTEIKNDIVNSNLSYASVTAGNKSGKKGTGNNEPVLIIKPKENQESKKTKKEIKEKIDPSSLGAGVSGMKEVSNGQVIIRCENKKDLEKIQNKIQEKMSADYDTKTPSLKHPKVKIIRINEDDDNTAEDLIEAIIDQNLTKQTREEEDFHIKIIKKIKKENERHFTLILETDPKTHKLLTNRDKIFIGWSRGKPYDYVHVIRCYKCQGFNHFAKDCKNNKICYKCSLQHEGECKAKHNKCINCKNAIQKYKIKINDDHNALDHNCPCYVRVLNSVKRRVDYLENQ